MTAGDETWGSSSVMFMVCSSTVVDDLAVQFLANIPKLPVIGAALLAAGVGIAGGRWLEPDVWRLMVALVALVVLALPSAVASVIGRSAREWSEYTGSKDLRTTLLALLAVAALAQATASDVWRFMTSAEVRVWNVYHYYLGAKYFDELGYHDLYRATLVADRQADDYWRMIDDVRDLRSYRREPRAIAEAGYQPGEYFSVARWESFKRDVVALQTQLPARQWRGIFIDRGYNPSPFWTVVGEALAGRFQASNTLLLKLLCALDLALLVATFVALRRTFGDRAAALVVLFFALTPVNNARLIGGFLQYDWFCAIALGVCAARRGRPVSAAGYLAYATLSRVFPVVLVASVAVPMVSSWVWTGRLKRRSIAFFLAFALFCGAGVGIGCLTGHGPRAWVEFVDNLGSHHEDHAYGQRRVGLKHVFTHDIRTLDLDESKSDRRDLFERQRGLYLATAAVLLMLFLLALHRRRFDDALLFGLVPFFVLAVSSRYYWAVLALLPLLARSGPAGAIRDRLLAAGQASVIAGYAAFSLLRSDRYAAYSMLNMWLVGFFLMLLALYLWRDLMVLRRHSGESPAWHQSRALVGVFFLTLFLVLCFLRLPLEDVPIRDVDESVSALIAASWLEGGVPYRDAIDQRGPLTYVVYALIFAVAGIHNMWAVHWGLLLLILGVAFVLFRFAADLRHLPDLQQEAAGVSLGYWAAFLFVIASFTYRRSQMLAFHTEWPMIVCTCVGMLMLWRGLRDGGTRPFVIAGAFYAGAFLSKQPAAFDAAAGGLFVLLWQWRRGQLWSTATVRLAALLFAGFAGVLAATAGYFWAAGALPDFALYFWQYNVDHYAKIVGWDQRWEGFNPFAHRRHYLTANYLLMAATLWQCGLALWHLVRHRRVGPRLLLTLWFLLAYFGASYSGRNFGHYFIQIIPAACLLTAWAIDQAWRLASPRQGRWMRLPDFAYGGRALVVAVVVLGLASPLVRFKNDIAWFNIHHPSKPDKPRRDALATIARETHPDDTIFVWGYYPELYVLSGRRPASRFSNTNYLTGMLPWENHQPDVDTSEHIVDGGWDILMTELEASRPKLVLDTAVGDHRYYSKYPVADFPRLEEFLTHRYYRDEMIVDRDGEPAVAVWQRRP